MRKSDYRSFNVRGLEDQDDFAAMRQVVGRRYKRRLEELGYMPDVILIDGGRGQLNAALGALSELGVEETPVVALAKRDEEIYLPERPEPLRLPKHESGLQLLQRIRDEAHRFADSRHRKRRSKNALRGRLDELDGVGPRRRRALLQQFGSLAGVREADLEQIQQLLGPKVGLRVVRQLHSESAENGSTDHSATIDDPVQ